MFTICEANPAFQMEVDMNLYLGNSLMDYRGPAEWDKVTLVTLQMGCGQDMEHHKSYYWGTLGTILF